MAMIGYIAPVRPRRGTLLGKCRDEGMQEKAH